MCVKQALNRLAEALRVRASVTRHGVIKRTFEQCFINGRSSLFTSHVRLIEAAYRLRCRINILSKHDARLTHNCWICAISALANTYVLSLILFTFQIFSKKNRCRYLSGSILSDSPSRKYMRHKTIAFHIEIGVIIHQT